MYNLAAAVAQYVGHNYENNFGFSISKAESTHSTIDRIITPFGLDSGFWMTRLESVLTRT